MKKWTALGLVLTLVATLAVGCKGEGKEKNGIGKFDSEDEAVLKVMFYDQQTFSMEYGKMFQMEYPNVEIEVVSSRSLYGADHAQEALDKLLEEHKPDVLFLNATEYQALSEQGRLLNLDHVIAQQEFDVDQLHPAVVETLRQQGNGGLFGLAPTMGTEVLFYNKTMFDEYGVPYPTDQMSWDQLFELAQRFPVEGNEEDRVYGFFRESFGNGLADSILTVGSTYGLTWLDESGSAVAMNTESWRNVLDSVLRYEQSGVIGTYDYSKETGSMNYLDRFRTNKFITGQAAMMLNGYHSLIQLQESETMLSDKKPFEWDIVTTPIDPDRPEVTNSFYVFNIFAINAESPNLSAAWALVEFINSDRMAKALAPTTYNLLARPEHMIGDTDIHMDAFYKLNPDTVQMNTGLENLPDAFYDRFREVLDEETGKTLRNEQTIEEALLRIEERGNAALEESKAMMNAGKN